MAFETLKERHSVVWGLGPYERVSAHLADAHERFLEAVGVRPGERWLDVATGTGEIARRAARRGAEVTGLDLAPALVERGRELAAEEGVDVRFEVGDAERMPFPDGAFDVVTSTFGVMFAPDHRAVAGELARVCAPGGRLGLLTWQPDSGVHDLFKVLAPFQPPPPDGVGNPFDWGRRRYVEDLLGEAFELRIEEGTTEQRLDSAEEFWELMAGSYGPTKALAESLDVTRREELHAHWLEFFGRYETDEGLRWPRPYLLVVGTRR